MIPIIFIISNYKAHIFCAIRLYNVSILLSQIPKLSLVMFFLKIIQEAVNIVKINFYWWLFTPLKFTIYVKDKQSILFNY